MIVNSNIFARLGKRLLTLRGMFVEVGTSACTWCLTSSRLKPKDHSAQRVAIFQSSPVCGLQFDPESLHMCTKLSGEAVQFSKREKFDSIVRHLTARCLAYFLFVVCTVYIKWTTSNRMVPFPIKQYSQKYAQIFAFPVSAWPSLLLTPLVQRAHEDE